MKSIYINGIGMITGSAYSVQDFWNYLFKPEINLIEQVQNLSSVRKSKTRRMDRISMLAHISAANALEDSNLEYDDPYDVGTVLNSDYCHSNSNLKFGKYIVDETPSIASPSVFINTVNNACVGYVCINLGLKGYSTMLISSNYIGYAIRLIIKDRAKAVIAGGNEEYCQNTFDAILAKGFRACECGISLVLSSEWNTGSYCRILSYHEYNLGGHPFFTENFSVDPQTLIKTMKRAIEKAKIQLEDISLIVTMGNKDAIGRTECEAIQMIFGDEIPLIRPKIILGETLGASLGLNISLGALVLKHQSVPKGLLIDDEFKDNNQNYNYVLVNHLSMSGGFITYILKR